METNERQMMVLTTLQKDVPAQIKWVAAVSIEIKHVIPRLSQ